MIGERIRRMRKEKGYSQAQMALKLHITQGAISQWENGSTAPSAEQVIALADFFGVSADDLLGRDTKKAPADAGDELRGRISRLNPQNREALSAYVDLLLTAQASTAPAPGSPGSKP